MSESLSGSTVSQSTTSEPDVKSAPKVWVVQYIYDGCSDGVDLCFSEKEAKEKYVSYTEVDCDDPQKDEKISEHVDTTSIHEIEVTSAQIRSLLDHLTDEQWKEIFPSEEQRFQVEGDPEEV